MLSPRRQVQQVLMEVPDLERLPPALQSLVGLVGLELLDHMMWGQLVLMVLEHLEGRGNLQRAAESYCSIQPVCYAQHCAPLCEQAPLNDHCLMSLGQPQIGLESLPADQGQDQRLPGEVRLADRGRTLQGLQNAHDLDPLFYLPFLEVLFG